MSEQDKSSDTTGEVESAREEVAQTEPAKAPLPDPEGLAQTLSPVDLPEPAEPLPDPLRWMVTVIAVAGLFLALFNAGSIRSWAYELKPTPVNERVVIAAESWFDMVNGVGLEAPVSTMRGWWKQVQSARFPGQEPGPQTETGPDAEAPEPAES
jgi:hypothetical protein